MASLESATPGPTAKLALLLSAANPKILLFAAAAGVTIGSAKPGGEAATVVVVVFAMLASVSVALPLASYLVAGERVLGPLRRARDWLQANNSAVMAVVITVIGALVLLKGGAGPVRRPAALHSAREARSSCSIRHHAPPACTMM